MGESADNVPLAIILTVAAGSSTIIGACLVFCVSPDRFEVLPIALAFSAGVMVYVSMVEILAESREGFAIEIDESSEYLAHIYASLCFFGGILIGYALDFIVHALGVEHDLSSPNASTVKPNDDRVELQGAAPGDAAGGDPSTNGQHIVEVPELDTSQETVDREKAENKQLIKTSLITALAIGLHNFPEGLATFVGTLADPELGITIAVAIAIHNIPEGVAVAMPIYFGTGSRWKALMWATISGIAEPMGGLIGYALINAVIHEAVYGVLFGITAGIMVYISLKELLPTARRKDIDDKYTSLLLFAGFLVMDISIVLFEI